MPNATVEVATLRDAVTKAAKVAPSKGTALDRAGGVVLELVGPRLTIRATDLEATFLQTMPVVGSEGEAVWRVSSGLLDSIVGKLPMELGAQVALTQAPGDIWLFADTPDVQAKMRLFDNDMPFPAWPAFDVHQLKPVEDFAARVNQVAWACDDRGQVLKGVHIDGERLWACDQTSVATVPLACPVEVPVTAPVQDIAWLLRDHPEVMLRAEADHLQLALDDDTQVTLRLYLGGYPDFRAFVDRATFPHCVMLERDRFMDAIDRVTAPFTDKYPVLVVDLTATKLSLTMEDAEFGRVEQWMDVEAEKPITFKLSPKDVREMISHCRSQAVELRYFEDPLKPIMVLDGIDYTATTMPRAVK